MVEVVLSVFGKVPSSFTEFILNILNSFYASRTEREKPAFVEVIVYGSSSKRLEVLYEEAVELGVEVLGDYAVSHEAWRGWPRIHVDYEKSSRLEPEVFSSLLIHEAAHSVLHGRRDYYLLPLDSSLPDELRAYLGIEALYLASAVVKDLEVHKYLVTVGYKKYVEEYARYSRREAVGLDCSDVIGTLNFAKLVAPCVYIECPSTIETFSESCARFYEPLLKTLSELEHLGEDWVEKSVMLAYLITRLSQAG
ncbi:MAG: hypothetical protein QW780_03345 [Sulfolobales archaeon]